MGRGELGVYDELFSYACPKFITAQPPSYEAGANTSQAAYRAQLNAFLTEVRFCTLCCFFVFFVCVLAGWLFWLAVYWPVCWDRICQG